LTAAAPLLLIIDLLRLLGDLVDSPDGLLSPLIPSDTTFAPECARVLRLLDNMRLLQGAMRSGRNVLATMLLAVTSLSFASAYDLDVNSTGTSNSPLTNRVA
jgi:hypothetical protein